MKFLTLKEQFTKTLADHITVSVEDLSANELALVNKAFDILEGNLQDLKAQSDEIKRLSVELANEKAMNDRDERNDEDDLRDID